MCDVVYLQASCVESLLEHRSGRGLCDCPDNRGATPAHYAALTGKEAVLSLLITKVTRSNFHERPEKQAGSVSNSIPFLLHIGLHYNSEGPQWP